MRPGARCPCQSRKKARRCCGPWLAGRLAPSPTALMRSRFAAYALGRADYIVATTHPDNVQFQSDTDAWLASIQSFSAATRFLGLRIVEASEIDGMRATVTFHATLQQGGKDASFTEQSTFLREADGRWRYRSGIRLSAADQASGTEAAG